jgi:hypothetical protein
VIEGLKDWGGRETGGKETGLERGILSEVYNTNIKADC